MQAFVPSGIRGSLQNELSLSLMAFDIPVYIIIVLKVIKAYLYILYIAFSYHYAVEINIFLQEHEYIGLF